MGTGGKPKKRFGPDPQAGFFHGLLVSQTLPITFEMANAQRHVFQPGSAQKSRKRHPGSEAVERRLTARPTSWTFDTGCLGMGAWDTGVWKYRC
jgi:hypothetical protein